MATRTIKPKRDDSMLSDWQSMPEVAPSSIRKEGNLVAQIFLFVGFFLSLVGVLALVAPLAGWRYFMGPGMGYMSLTIGLALVLYHCHVDPEPQFKILYSFIALAMVVGAVFVRFLSWTKEIDSYFFALGVPMLFVAMLFIIGILRGPMLASLSKVLRAVLLVGGAVMLACGAFFGFLYVDFLTGEGILLMTLGLAYIGSFLLLTDESDPAFFPTALALGAFGGLTIVSAVLVALAEADFFVPRGAILCGVGLFALGMSTLLVCDWPLVVLTRRELAGFFYSPIAYLVLFGVAIILGIHFGIFAFGMLQSRGAPEPIVRPYVWNFLPVVAIMVLVPILTMRLLSDETRTGSLEVLLTAPVNEVSVILAKFFASLIFFLIAWSPFFLFMVGFRVFGGEEFDYRPLLSFLLALTVSGAALLAMGLFFSSLTSNQIVAAVLTFAGLIAQMLFLSLPDIFGPGGFSEMLSNYSFLELWWNASQGFIALRFFVFQASYAVFFLFLTYLVLSSRKWK